MNSNLRLKSISEWDKEEMYDFLFDNGLKKEGEILRKENVDVSDFIFLVTDFDGNRMLENDLHLTRFEIQKLKDLYEMALFYQYLWLKRKNFVV